MRRSLSAGLLSSGLLLAVAVPASAEGAERAGWWNRLSAGPLTAPAPGAEPGDLRISGRGAEVTAFAAVLLRAGQATEGTLDLEVRPDSVGSVAVVACPTQDEAWPEGDNQPFDKAPAYDCEAGRSDGVLSEDGKTLTFELDGSTQLAPGTWSLALVPDPDAAGPFSVDLAPVGPDALTPATSSSDEGGAGGSDPAPAAEPPPASGGSGTTTPPLLTGSFDEPILSAGPATGAADAPLLAGGADVPLPAEQPDPAVAADSAPTLDLVPTAPVGRTALANHESLATGPRLLALLVLAGGSAAVGYAAGQQRSGPRLLGGRRRSVVPAGVPVAQDEPTTPDERPRGIGRFARERDGAPRRLR